MAPIADKPFLEWVVRYLAKQGIRQTIISTGYMAETVAGHFQSQPVSKVRTMCIAETKPLGTAGGFLHASQTSGETSPAWLVLNGDSLAFVPVLQLVAELQDSRVSAVIAGVTVPDASRYGSIILGSRGELLRFEEKRPGQGVINAGIYLFRDSLLKEFPRRVPLSFEKDLFPALTSQQACLKVLVTNASFLDIGTPESLPRAETFIEQHESEFDNL